MLKRGGFILSTEYLRAGAGVRDPWNFAEEREVQMVECEKGGIWGSAGNENMHEKQGKS